MPASAPPPPSGPSFVVRFGTALGTGALAALACALPATLRVASGDDAGGTPHAWLALAAAALAPMVVAVLVLRGAHEGLRAFAGPGAGLRAFGMALWLASLVVGLTIFGSVLRSHTHHHGLAGVTFAFGALAAAVGSGLVCARLVAIARDASDVTRRLLVLGTSGAAALALAYVGMRFVHGAAADAASYGAAGTVVDVLAFGLAAYFASRPALAARPLFAMVGPVVALALLGLGVTTLRTAPMHAAIGARAPAFAPVVDSLSTR